MTPAPERRWFRFSVRTLFVVLTVVGCWLGWNVHVVRQRRAMLREIAVEDQAFRSVVAKIVRTGGEIGWGHRTVQKKPLTPAQIPLIRRLLGDQAQFRILRYKEADARRAVPFFPEAAITYYDPVKTSAWVRARIDEEFRGEE